MWRVTREWQGMLTPGSAPDARLVNLTSSKSPRGTIFFLATKYISVYYVSIHVNTVALI